MKDEKQLKETMKQTANKTQEDLRTEIRKLESEMTEIKNLVGK